MQVHAYLHFSLELKRKKKEIKNLNRRSYLKNFGKNAFPTNFPKVKVTFTTTISVSIFFTNQITN